MSDTELIAWLESGAKPVLAEAEAAARRHRDFALRFSEAMDPTFDLGPTDELHQAGIARAVYAVHRELNALGEESYSAVWALLGAPTRRALKAYIAMAKSD